MNLKTPQTTVWQIVNCKILYGFLLWYYDEWPSQVKRVLWFYMHFINLHEYTSERKNQPKKFFDVIMPRSKIFHKCLNKFKISWVALWRMRNWCLNANGIFSLPYVICCLLLKIYVPSVNHNKLFAFCLNLHSISSQSFFFFGHLHRCTHTYTRAHIQIHSHLQ